MEREFQINWPSLVEEAVRRRRGMKLTQKQLAALANVSTPTVSRFENAEKDLQLSTVLAILDVLGMTDKRTLSFADAEHKADSDGKHQAHTLLLRLDRRGLIQRDLWCVDATINRAGAAAAGAEKKSGRASEAGRANSDANDGATRACAGAFPGRLRHQDASGL